MAEVTTRTVLRVKDGAATKAVDELAVEEPLEIRWAGEPVAVTMRTPGRDHDLVLGFLRSEGVIASAADVGSVVHCGRPGDGGYGNAIDVTPGPGTAVGWEKRFTRRGTVMTAACGVCGRATIDDLLARVAPMHEHTVTLDAVHHALRVLRESQPAFARTGGLHGAAAFAEDGTLLASAEDIGRHNAVDKVCGALLREGKRAHLLAVSSRLGFEIAQKAAVSRIPVVISVSAASSLAVDVGLRLGLTLVGFVRENRMNVYSGADRVAGLATP